MKEIRIGLLPLYLKLYDDRNLSDRKRIEKFVAQVAADFSKRGMMVETAPVCRIASEFRTVIHRFERANVDALVTLHLAYSPSLESAAALASTKLPIVVLDTTPTWSFAPDQDPAELMHNHGIHGVQDMCNLLIRNNKPFTIEAGHWKKSDVIDRTVSCIKGAVAASCMKSARVGRIGPAFKGMGDFDVPSTVLKKTLGVQTVPCTTQELKALTPGASSKDVSREIARDRKTFKMTGIDSATHKRSVRVQLAIERLIKKKKLTAFSANFQNFTRKTGVPTLPFLAASKAMASGIGYAGEGDVLTAAFVGALASVFPDTSFTEMFCPNWKDGTVFLSHMGELNYRLVSGKPTLMEKDLPFCDIDNPAVACGRFRSGNAFFLNLAPWPDNEYCFIIAPIKMTAPRGKDRMNTLIRGWFKPGLPINDFLAEYSRYGGTHHAALVYDTSIEALAAFGQYMGWETVVI